MGVIYVTRAILQNGRVKMPIRFDFIEEVSGDVLVFLLIFLTIDGTVCIVEPSGTVGGFYKVICEFLLLFWGIATGEV